jgi:hypothetical protein
MAVSVPLGMALSRAPAGHVALTTLVPAAAPATTSASAAFAATVAAFRECDIVIDRKADAVSNNSAAH